MLFWLTGNASAIINFKYSSTLPIYIKDFLVDQYIGPLCTTRGQYIGPAFSYSCFIVKHNDQLISLILKKS